MDNYLGKGDVITVDAGAGGVVGGTVWRGTDVTGVYVQTAASGEKVGVQVEGEVNVSKAAAAGTAFTVGQLAYATTGLTATPATGANNLPLGYAISTAATGDTAVKVKLATF